MLTVGAAPIVGRDRLPNGLVETDKRYRLIFGAGFYR